MPPPIATPSLITVRLVEDNRPFRENLAGLLDQTEGFSCPQAVGNAEKTLRLPATQSAAHIVGRPCAGNKMSRLPRRTRPIRAMRPDRAFSLVETVLAMGIIAFALTTLVAVLPFGMTQFRQGMDISLGAQISQRVVADIEQMEFDTLLAAGAGANGNFFALPTRYFDDQGNEVAAGDAARTIYHVRVRAAPPGPAAVQAGETGFTSLPAGPGDARFAPRDAVFLTVQIAHYPLVKELAVGPDALWLRTGAQSSVPIRTYSAVVTRNGYLNRLAP